VTPSPWASNRAMRSPSGSTRSVSFNLAAGKRSALPGPHPTVRTPPGSVANPSGAGVLEYRFPYHAAAGIYAATGTVLTTLSASGSPSPVGEGGVALDAHGDLFVSNPDASDVLEYRFHAATRIYASTGIVVAARAGTAREPASLTIPPASRSFTAVTCSLATTTTAPWCTRSQPAPSAGDRPPARGPAASLLLGESMILWPQAFDDGPGHR
jgi:hypothetical protein